MFVSMSCIYFIKFVACLWSCCAISVDGGYSNWGSYTSCSATCGGGEQVRTRQCNNPTPQYKGKDCKWIGPANETRACNTFYCPSELVTSVCCNITVIVVTLDRSLITFTSCQLKRDCGS